MFHQKIKGIFQDITYKVVIGLIVTILVSSAAFLWHKHNQETTKLTGNAGEWLRDNYVSIRFPDKCKGTILSDEPYNLKMDIQNRTANTLYVSKIITRRFNDKAAKLLKETHDLIHTHEYHVPVYLPPNEMQTVLLNGNEILPKIIEVEVYHNLAVVPSKFKVDVKGIVISPPVRKPFSNKVVLAGMDSLAAIKQASAKVSEQSKEFYILSAFPGTNKTYFDDETGLKFIEVEGWVVTFCSPTHKQFAVVIEGNDINDYGDTQSEESCNPVPLPKIGNQEALRLANDNGLIRADWSSFRLVGGRIGERWTCAWALPYLGPDSLPIMIDALTGDQLDWTEGENSEPTFEIKKRLTQ